MPLLSSHSFVVFLWMLASSCVSSAESSHFKGAAISWRPGTIYEEEGLYELLIDIRITWRHSTEEDSSSTFCSQDDIDSGKKLLLTLSESFQWSCRSGCNGTVAANEVTCTQFDEIDDWSVGYGTSKLNLTEPGPFQIDFSGCCWVENLVYVIGQPTEWNITIAGSLGIRSDTGQPNRTPVSATNPIVRFQAGCPNFVDIVMHDPDGDDVTCKLADCDHPICSSYPYLKITQQGKMCRVSYNAGGPGNTNVALAIVLEDHPRKDTLTVDGVRQNTTTTLSSVAMQFIVILYNDETKCVQKPIWSDPTFPNGLLKTAAAHHEFIAELALSSTNGLKVLNVIGPVGLSKTPLANDTDTEYTANLSFTPTEDHIGTHMICVSAKDEDEKMSDQRCLVLKVGEGSPCDVDKGGCDDECVRSGDSYYCACTRECWRLAEDRRTCIPDVVIECKPESFAIQLPVCAVSANTVTIGYDRGTNTKTCEAELAGSSFAADVKYSDCLTESDSDFSEVHYWNNLRMWVDDAQTFPGSGDDKFTITRGFFYNMEIVCSFSKYANVNATFTPQDREEGLVRVPGLGSFQFFFDFFMDHQFGATYSPYEYPITVTVNSEIYFGIRTVGGSGLQVFTEKCIAMTTPTATEGTVSYTIIQDGCLSDLTLQRHDAPTTMEDRFSIKAFRFQDSLNVDSQSNIYIQCSAVLCVIGDPATRCQRGCIRSRKRRDGEEILVSRHKRTTEEEEDELTTTRNISESTLLDITVSGPFRIEVEHTEGTPLVTVVTPTEPVGTPTAQSAKTNSTITKKVEVVKEQDSLTVVIIASSVGVVLFIILVVVLVGLICYYHIVLHPRHKIIPDKGSTPRSLSAWSLDDRENIEMPPIKPETPPPSFWDIEPLT